MFLLYERNNSFYISKKHRTSCPVPFCSWLLRDRQPPAMPVEIIKRPAKKLPMIE